MQITPIVLHAAMRLPAVSPLFSDALAVTSMTLAPDGDVVLTTSAPHGVMLGSKTVLAITAAGVGNPIAAAVLEDDGNLTLTTTYDHDFTTAPAGNEFTPWDAFVTLSGFSDPLINGQRQLVGVLDARTIIVRPGGPVDDTGWTAEASVLDRLPPSVTGWHAAEATGATTLAFPAGADVSRSMTVATPTVVRDIRVWGAVDFATAMKKFVSDNESMSAGKAHMFIMPLARVRTSRARAAKTDAIAEVSQASELRLQMLDGFSAVVFLPAKENAGAIAAADKCHGPILHAVLRTFLGLKLPRPELMSGQEYCAILGEHGTQLCNGAIYAHVYSFEQPATISRTDALAPYEQADFGSWQPGADPAAPVPDTIAPIGAPAYRGIDFTGILHDGQPQPLTASLDFGDETP